MLHLIREQEMDIFNININQITRQYLEYIKTMRRLDLEVAGEFVAMAATLIHIKSRMLLPQYNEEGEEIPVEDPRKDLVQKLLEYKKFQELSQQLYKLPLLGRDVFRRGERTEIESLEEGEVVLDENPLYSLIASYRNAVKNMKKTVHRVSAQLLSIGERIMQMKDMFIVGRRMVFNDLISDKENPKNQVLLTFLSLLELAKMGFVSVFQSEPFADIHIDTKKPIDRDVISQVESYDGVNAMEKANEIMADAQLSLEETEVLAEDEAGDETVVQESFADAASDDDILAEEMKIANEEQGIVAEAVTATETVSTSEAVAEVEAEQVSVEMATAEPVAESEPVSASVSDAVSAALAASAGLFDTVKEAAPTAPPKSINELLVLTELSPEVEQDFMRDDQAAPQDNQISEPDIKSELSEISADYSVQTEPIATTIEEETTPRDEEILAHEINPTPEVEV
ncbi:MAG: segregation/condensation protein A [Bdellovibrionales bacterium]